MKIRSLSRFVLAGILLASFNASAVSGLWQQVYGQGNAEYSVTDASGKMFTINCTENPDQNGIYQHSVFLTLAGDKTVSSHDNSTDITVVMDHKQYAIPSTLGWRNGDNAWFSFIMDIRKARQFSVYVNDRKAGTFTADLKNAEKVLPTPGDCGND
ncbi:protein YfjT [Enterobacter hormaechei]